MSSTLSYRLYESKDLGQVLELWEKNSDWGGITEKQFTDWYLKTPNGPCIIVVAQNERQQVVGQEIFTPSRLYLKGQDIKGLRVSAPIIHNSIRGIDIKNYDHPVFAMFRYGMQVAKQLEYSLVYLFPALGWTSVLKLFPRFGLPYVQVATFDCIKISLKDASTFKLHNQDLKVTVLKEKTTEEYNQLWHDAITNFPISCGVIRDKAWLNWKLGGHILFEVRELKYNQLKGYVALKKDSGLLVDMLAKTKEDMDKIFFAVIDAIHQLNVNKIKVPWPGISVMYTSMFQSFFQNIKFETADYRFAFGCFPLNESVHDNDIRPSSWYMMPND